MVAIAASNANCTLPKLIKSKNAPTATNWMTNNTACSNAHLLLSPSYVAPLANNRLLWLTTFSKPTLTQQT
jgi:hypothetical protein